MRHLAFQQRGQGPPLLLVPGAGADASCWERLAASLESFFELHLAEIAGFAARPRASGPLWPAVRDELVGYASSLAGPPLVVGHSWGGLLAWSLRLCGAPVRGLVVIDTMPALGVLIATEAASLPEDVAKRVAGLRSVAPDELGRFLEPSIRTMTVSDAQAEQVLAVAARSDPVTLAEAMEAAWLADLRPALAEVGGVPVRVILPGDEHLPSNIRARKHQLVREQVACLPEHRVIEVADAGHYVMLDRPDALASIVHDVAEGV